MNTQSPLLASLRSIPLVVAGLLAACGGATRSSGASEPNTLAGTVAGTSFPVASELALVTTTDSSNCTPSLDPGSCAPAKGEALVVVLTNRSDATCAALQDDYVSGVRFGGYANFDALVFEARVENGSVSAGAYDIAPLSPGDSYGTTASFGTSTSTCTDALSLSATGGVLDLVEVSSTRVAGTYSVTFGTSGSFAGSFDVAVCGEPAGTPPPGGRVVCQP